MKVLIVEDDEDVALFLKQIIEEIPDMKVVNISNDGKVAIRNIEIHRPHAIFIDINMPETNGLIVAREATEMMPDVQLIFATAYADYTLEAFNLYSFDYILKPFEPKRIHKTLRKIKDNMVRSKQFNHILVISLEDRKVIIKTEEILFIESNGHKLTIKTEQAKYTTRGEISKMEAKLDSRSFFRSHKGYIVNLKKVKEIVPSNRTFEVILSYGDRVLLSREREKMLKDKYLFQ